MVNSAGVELFDVIVVGGGPAGLSAALVLGRCLRRVLVCDDGRPRNGSARVFNGYLSRDGSTPREFLEISRQQLGRYETVHLQRCRVTAIERGDSQFAVSTAEGQIFHSRIVLLANGIVDELPEIPGLAERYGTTVHSCPYCDGWEHRGQRMAVIGGDQAAANLAVELLLWSNDVVLCTNGPLESTECVERQLEAGAVHVVPTAISALEGEGDLLTGIRFSDGRLLRRDVIFVAPRQRQRSPLAEQLGCAFVEGDNSIDCDSRGSTQVPGLYAAGNTSRGAQLVIIAAAEGTLAAMAINDALLEADAEAGKLQPA